MQNTGSESFFKYIADLIKLASRFILTSVNNAMALNYFEIEGWIWNRYRQAKKGSDTAINGFHIYQKSLHLNLAKASLSLVYR